MVISRVGLDELDAPRIGSLLKQGNAHYVVESVKATFVPEDGLSFGLSDDQGWIFNCECRAANSEEVPESKAPRSDYAKALGAKAKKYRTEIFPQKGRREVVPYQWKGSDDAEVLCVIESPMSSKFFWYVVEGGKIHLISNEPGGRSESRADVLEVTDEILADLREIDSVLYQK